MCNSATGGRRQRHNREYKNINLNPGFTKKMFIILTLILFFPLKVFTLNTTCTAKQLNTHTHTYPRLRTHTAVSSQSDNPPD